MGAGLRRGFLQSTHSRAQDALETLSAYAKPEEGLPSPWFFPASGGGNNCDECQTPAASPVNRWMRADFQCLLALSEFVLAAVTASAHRLGVCCALLRNAEQNDRSDQPRHDSRRR